MSSLIGTSADRWSLARAIDALGEAARQAGSPSWVWLVGILYPSVGLGFVVSWDGVLSAVPQRAVFSALIEAVRAQLEGRASVVHETFDFSQTMSILPCLGLFVFPLYRFLAGLARISTGRSWSEACHGRRAPTLRVVWRAGEGLTFATYGMWFQLALVMLCGTLMLGAGWWLADHVLHEGGRLVGLWDMRVFLTGFLLAPVVVVLLLFLLAVSVLMQLSLHSLAHNRRGVGSALLHAWRILRHDVAATARAILVDVLLFLSILAIWKILDSLVGDLPGGSVATEVVKLVLVGFAGVARAGYWARAYRALGGLSPDDGVPGLVQA